jgi:hypothetical protein
MPLACNIDTPRRGLRIGLGALLVGLGVAAAVDARFLVAALLIGGGAFSLFEGVKGWCAVKAVFPRFPL